MIIGYFAWKKNPTLSFQHHHASDLHRSWFIVWRSREKYDILDPWTTLTVISIFHVCVQVAQDSMISKFDSILVGLFLKLKRRCSDWCRMCSCNRWAFFWHCQPVNKCYQRCHSDSRIVSQSTYIESKQTNQPTVLKVGSELKWDSVWHTDGTDWHKQCSVIPLVINCLSNHMMCNSIDDVWC